MQFFIGIPGVPRDSFFGIAKLAGCLYIAEVYKAMSDASPAKSKWILTGPQEKPRDYVVLTCISTDCVLFEIFLILI